MNKPASRRSTIVCICRRRKCIFRNNNNICTYAGCKVSEGGKDFEFKTTRGGEKQQLGFRCTSATNLLQSDG